jgi:hypothetical protein
LQKVIIGCPTIIARDGKRTLLPIVTYLLELFDGDKKAVCSLMLKFPVLFCLSVEKNLKPKVKYLLNEVFGGNKTSLQSDILSFPQFFSCSLDGRIKPRVEALLNAGQDPALRITSFLKLNKEDFEARFDVVSTENNKDPSNATDGLSKEQHRKEFLMNELHMNSKQVKRMVDRAPTIVTLTEFKLMRTIQFFRETFNFSNEELGKLFCSYSCIFQSSVDDNIQPKIAFLLDLFDGDLESVRFIILRQPPVMKYSVEKNLKPKVVFLTNEVYSGDLVALRSAILYHPSLLGYSLENRIKPRFEAITSIGMDPSSVTLSILSKTNDTFYTWLENRQSELMAEEMDGWC